jgi:prevent-host-death family protein
MVILVIITIGVPGMAPRGETGHDAWSVAEAKARLSEVIDRAQGEPQVITRNGKPSAIVVSVEEWARKTTRKGTLAEFLLNSRSGEPNSTSTGSAMTRAISSLEVSFRYERPLGNPAAGARPAGSGMAGPAGRGSRLH